VQETVRLLKKFEEVSGMMESRTRTSMLSLNSRENSRGIDHRNAWDLDSRLDQAMDALRCPPPGTPASVLSGGERRVWLSAGCSCRSRMCCCSMNRRTTRRRIRSLARTAPGALSWNGACGHPRQILLDNVAGWILELDRGEGIPFRATTQAGLSRNASDFPWRRNRNPSGREPSPASWSG